MKINENTIWNTGDNIKWANLHIIGISDGEENGKMITNTSEGIIALNFLDLKKVKIAQYREHKDSVKQDEPKQTYTKTFYN